MEQLRQAQVLLVQQKKEWGEILTGFETRNRFAVCDTSGRQLYWAAEESSMLARWFLKSLRPFAMHILNPQGALVLKFTRPFRFFLHEISISDMSGKYLGMIKQKFSIFSRQFLVRDATGREVYKIYGPFFHPWTFRILKNEREIGKIQKRWSGLGKEMFTDADNFNIEFPREASVEQKSILLGALFLIDMLCFERSK